MLKILNVQREWRKKESDQGSIFVQKDTNNFRRLNTVRQSVSSPRAVAQSRQILIKTSRSQFAWFCAHFIQVWQYSMFRPPLRLPEKRPPPPRSLRPRKLSYGAVAFRKASRMPSNALRSRFHMIRTFSSMISAAVVLMHPCLPSRLCLFSVSFCGFCEALF